MANKLNIEPKTVFAPFKKALGAQWDKVCNDAKSFLGRIEKETLKSTSGEWKVGTKGKLKSKEGHEVQLPLNNPMSTLILFGMQLNEIASKANFGGNYEVNEKTGEVVNCGMEVEIPQYCRDWISNGAKNTVTLESEKVEVTK